MLLKLGRYLARCWKQLKYSGSLAGCGSDEALASAAPNLTSLSTHRTSIMLDLQAYSSKPVGIAPRIRMAGLFYLLAPSRGGGPSDRVWWSALGTCEVESYHRGGGP
jgi:hypothetical protein